MSLSVSTLVLGRQQASLPPVELTGLASVLSLRELISGAVIAQLALLQQHNSESDWLHQQLAQQYRYPVLATNDAVVTAPLDWQQEAERACMAFQQRRFKVFVDGIEFHDLASSCRLAEHSRVQFVALIPLVGG